MNASDAPARLSRRSFGLGALLAGTALATAATRPAQAATQPPDRINLRLSDEDNSSVGGIAEIRFFADSVDGYRRALGSAATIANDPWLALSGGGDNGAFGAGLLVGWTADRSLRVCGRGL